MDFDLNWTMQPKGTASAGGTGGNTSAENVDGNEPAPNDPLAGNGISAKSTLTPKSNRSTLGNPPADTWDDDEATDEGTSMDAGSQSEPAKSGAVARPDGFAALFSPSRGRNTILTDKLIQEFCEGLRHVIFQELAAAEVGILPKTLKQWLYQGRIVKEFLWDAMQEVMLSDWDREEAEKRFEEKVLTLTDADWQVYKLYEAVQRAKAEGERDDLEFIARARAKDWKAAKYRLEIRNPERYRVDGGSKTQVRISQTDTDGKTTFEVVNYNDWVNAESEEPIEVEAEIIQSED